VEKPWGRQAAAVPGADGGPARPWTLPLHGKEASELAEVARTACLIVAAAISAMRAGELMELTVGCGSVEEVGPGLRRFRLAGKVIKGRGLGGEPERWVVVEEVHRAVELAEQLLDHQANGASLFGRFAFDARYATFRSWVNRPAGQRLGLAAIPREPVNPRMLRRTLAVELAYRPGGLLAAKIHLKHISVATTEGYAARPGGAQAKLLAEVGEHEQRRNLQLVLAEYRNYQNGIMPSGPGARELVAFFAGVDGKPTEQGQTAPPKTLASDQELRNLLSKRAEVLHLGAANYCWFVDPSRALCLKLAGNPTADRPLIGMCDSARCPQATHHPRHRPVWADAVAKTAVFLGELGPTRKAERRRLEAEHARAVRVLGEIDNASATAAGREPAG
jgi:hypothetical protein